MDLAAVLYSREQRAKRACLHAHLATAASLIDKERMFDFGLTYDLVYAMIFV